MNNIAEQSTVIIECKSVSKDFKTRKGQTEILKNVSFCIRQGDITLISGKTGVGKSTLLGLLGGLDRPTSGEIWLDGRRIDNLSGTEWSSIRRNKVSILFQNFNLLPSWTTFENVEAAMLHTGIGRTTRYDRIKSLLAEFGLENRMDHLPCELSVGQQQLIALARAIINKPAILLADEPTGDVDPETAQEMVNRLVSLRRNGTTVVVATHGNFPPDAAQRRFVLADGCVRPG